MGDSMVQDQSEPLEVQTGDGTTPDRRSLAVTLYRRRLAVFAFMLVYGLGMSSWVVRTPAVRDLLNASTAQMGLVLLGLSVGSMTGILSSARAVRRGGV